MKVIKRILVGIGILIFVVLVFLVGSVVVDSLMGGGRLDPLVNAQIANPKGPEIPAYVARPSTPGPHPAVIMIHEFWGLREDMLGKADALAQEGYIVVAPSMFRDSTTSWVPRAVYQVISTSQEQINNDLDAVYAWLTAEESVHNDQIAIMGFCFGGGTSLRYSLHNNQIAATVILYGSLITDPEQLKSLPGPVLGIFGGADQSIPLEEVSAFENALNDLDIPNQITIYEGQPHAFVQDIEEIRKGGSPGKAWEEVLKFLQQSLRTNTNTQQETNSSTQIASLDWQYLFMLAYEHVIGHDHQH